MGLGSIVKKAVTAPVDLAKKAAKKATGADNNKGANNETEALRQENAKLREELEQRQQVASTAPPTLNGSLYGSPNGMGAGFGVQQQQPVGAVA